MMQKIKKPVSILLSILMVLSLFTVVPIASASAAEKAFVKVTSEPTDWSGEYLVVYEVNNEPNKVFNSAANLSTGANTLQAEFGVSDGNIDYDDTTAAAAVTIAKIEDTGYYSIKTASGKYIGRSNDTNGIDERESALDNTIAWDNGSVKITSAGGAIMRYNTGASQFRYYKTASYTNQQPIQLYKLTAGDDPAPTEPATEAAAPTESLEYTFVKVTSEPTDWSGEYLVVYEVDGEANKVFDSAANLAQGANILQAEFGVSDGNIDYDATTAAATVTIAKIEGTGNYSIKVASGKYIGKTNDTNGLDQSEAELDNIITWDNGSVKITSEGGAIMRYNTGTSQFRYYRSATYTNQQPIQLYKLTAAEAPTEASYTVTWKNWNGEELETDTNVAKDTLPSYDGAAPTRPDDANNTYTFAAWDDGTTTYLNGVDDLPPVTGDVTYTAVFTADPKTTEAPTEAPQPADTYIVAGNDTAIFGTSWNGNDPNNTMTFSNDVWSKEYTVDSAKKDVQLKAVKNGSQWIGDETGNNVTFNLSDAGTFTVYCDGSKTWVDGDIVTYNDGLTVESVTVVGNGTPDGDNWLNNIEWDPAASANHMTILSAGLYEIEYTLGDYDTSDPEFKFAINDAWTHNFGLADGGVIANGVETDAIYNGPQNIKITGLPSGTTIKMYLDLTEFDYNSKTGAKMTITWTVPATEAPTETPTEAPTEPPVVPIVYNLNDETANILWEDRCSIDSYWDIYVETDGINFLLGALNSTQAAGTYTWSDLDPSACEIFVGEALTPYHFTDGSCTVTIENDTLTVSGIFTCEDGNTYDLTFSTGRIYSVTWMNGDEILKIDTNLAVGDIPSYSGETPVKIEDDDFTYEFMGWSDENGVYNPDALPPVSGDATYVAEFKSTPKYAAGYYIIGTMTDWKINDAYMLTPNNNIESTEYMFEDFSINMGDMFKVVYAEAGKDKVWYPEGMGNNYGENGEFTTGGYYTVYFRPDGDGGEDWFYNCIYVVCTMTDAAMLVNGQINVLPEAEDVTLNDKAAVEAARADYDALSDTDKAFVDPALLQKLTDVETALANLEAAKTVENQINALPDVIIYDDKADVEAARQAYDALTDAQKALVDPAALQKLTDAEQSIAVREPAKAVEALIFALPDTITLDDKADVEAARAALNALTPEQAEYVTFIALDKLFRAEDAIADLEAAKTVENQINALPDVIIYDDKADVEAARQAYDALTDAQKALVDPAALQKLTDAEQSISVREPAKAVEALIFALPDTITLADKADVEAARAALNALTPEQAEYVTFIALDKLFRAEDAIAAAEVTAMIDALPAADDVTVNDETDIINARAAYDALSDAQKVLIDADTLQKLTDDEAAINSFVLLGDADGDGGISILDATFIQRYLADFDLTVPFNEKAADVDGDDDISILDAAFIQRFLVDMDVDYPINQYVKR